ncbi:hypothetical protein CcaCcLH18_14115 [Colletotrichum camelliae]|nr:hypothetical protein CcaCcLH18_14115 [Colletotrichum camelliae]
MRLGDPDINYDNIDYSTAEDYEPSIRFSKMAIGVQQFATAHLEAALGPKDSGYQVKWGNGAYEDTIFEAKQVRVVLYDAGEARAWFANGAEVILHMIRTRSVQRPFTVGGNRVHIPSEDSVVETLLRHRDLELLLLSLHATLLACDHPTQHSSSSSSSSSRSFPTAKDPSGKPDPKTPRPKPLSNVHLAATKTKRNAPHSTRSNLDKLLSHLRLFESIAIRLAHRNRGSKTRHHCPKLSLLVWPAIHLSPFVDRPACSLLTLTYTTTQTTAIWYDLPLSNSPSIALGGRD